MARDELFTDSAEWREALAHNSPAALLDAIEEFVRANDVLTPEVVAEAARLTAAALRHFDEERADRPQLVMQAVLTCPGSAESMVLARAVRARLRLALIRSEPNSEWFFTTGFNAVRRTVVIHIKVYNADLPPSPDGHYPMPDITPDGAVAAMPVGHPVARA